MRTSILAAALLGVFTACTGTIDSGGGGDDVQGGPDCGDGVVDSGESCDDGNTASGDGCSASCETEATPRIAIAVDKASVETELRTSHELNLTVTSDSGFSGIVDLSATVVDASSMPITGWTVTLDPERLTLTENGTGTAKATVTIPSQNMGLEGVVQVVAASSVGTRTAATQITVNNQLSYEVRVDNGQCVFPMNAGGINDPVRVTVGTKVRFVNTGNVNFVIHSNGEPSGIPHQGTAANQSPDDPITEPGPLNAYERVTRTSAQLNQTFTWYCHQPDTNLGTLNPAIRVVP